MLIRVQPTVAAVPLGEASAARESHSPELTGAVPLSSPGLCGVPASECLTQDPPYRAAVSWEHIGPDSGVGGEGLSLGYHCLPRMFGQAGAWRQPAASTGAGAVLYIPWQFCFQDTGVMIFHL